MKRILLNARIAQLVEHNLAKVGVASSSLVSRSIKKAIKVNLVAFFLFYRMKTHLTYIIYSEIKDQYYVGSTSVDISLRLERHNQG